MGDEGTTKMTDKPRDRERIMSMKEWLFTKLQIPFTDNVDGAVVDEAAVDEVQSGNVPTIVISRGSSKSINNLLNSPVIRAKQTLMRAGSDCSTLNNAHPLMNSKPDFSISPLCKSDLVRTRSDIVDPDLSISEGGRTSAQSSPGKISRSFLAMSPVFRFSLRNNLATTVSTKLSQQSMESCQTDSDAESQIVHSISLPLVDDVETVSRSPERTVSLQRPNRNLDIRRTSSCGVPVSRSFNKNRERFSKTNSQSDDHFNGKNSGSEKLKRSREVRSVENSKSTVSLTRSITKSSGLSKPTKSSKFPEARKLSLINGDELNRVYARRRSSLIRLFSCSATSEDADKDSIQSEHAPSVLDDNGPMSPKLTRQYFIGSLKRSGSPFDNFRSTFESDLREVPTVYGQVKLMFQYMTSKNQLQVTVLRGCNMASEIQGQLGIYSTICMLPGKKQKQRGKNKHTTHNPTFQDLFCFGLTLDKVLEGQLKVKFYSKPGPFSWPVPVGECQVDLYSYDLTAVTVIWKNLNRSKGQKSQQEEFDFTLIGKGEDEKDNTCAGTILSVCPCIQRNDADLDDDSIN